MLNRRELIKVAAAGAGLSLLPFARANDLGNQLQESDLVYLTPIQSNGKESSCQSEIWFVWDGADIFVCTETSSWRAQAPRKGLNRTRIWIGDLGNWKSTNGKYKSLPRIETATSVVTDQAVHKTALDLFAKKYPIGWLRWGDSFRSGLASGSKTLLKYQPLPG